MLSPAWVPLTLVAVLLLLTPLQGYALPLCLRTAILLAGYGRSISRSRTGVDPWPPGTRIIVGVLLALATFWTTGRLARTIGQAFGADIAARPTRLPAVVLYSARTRASTCPAIVKAHRADPEVQFVRGQGRGVYCFGPGHGVAPDLRSAPSSSGTGRSGQ